MIGSILGHYEIVEPLGTGGMGEVYRARDTRLGRDVAIKVMAADFVADPQRLARFEREAQLLASLNHSNIAAIYGLEEHGDQRFIVMEVVEGDTLARRIDESGGIDTDDALDLALQVAEALEAAHESGVIHRDLKPANVMVAAGGVVKVLDFGLAKAYGPDDAGAGKAADMSQSPTTLAHTHTGVIMGTAAYMSPEQARGRMLDKRTDVWSFGCLLYEMLTGRRAFGGENAADTLAKILKEEPDWALLPDDLPPAIERLLRRMLHKNPKNRLRDVGDARIELQEAKARPSPSDDPADDPSSTAVGRTATFLLAAAALIVGVLLGFVVSGLVGPVATPGVVRSTIMLEPDLRLRAIGDPWQRPTRTAFAVSPYGTRLAFTAADETGSQRLYLRELGGEPVLLPNTEGAIGPFFSPTGQAVGFFAGGDLKTISLATNEVQIVASGRGLPFGATWGPDGTIVFADNEAGGLYHVPASGGRPEPLTEIDRGGGETGHRMPHFLPDGSAVLFTIWRGEFRWSAAQIAVYSVESGDRTVVVEDAADPHYAPSGHLLFTRRGTLVAVRFDPTQLEVVGEQVTLLDDVMQAIGVPNTQLDSGAAQFAISASGLMAYVPGGVSPDLNTTRLILVDREGAEEAVSAPPGLGLPRFAPAGTPRIAYQRAGDDGFEIWIHDIDAGNTRRLAAGINPVWSPDGDRIAFSSTVHGGAPNLYLIASDGSSGEPIRLTHSEVPHEPSSWEGDLLAFVVDPEDPDVPADRDIWVLPMTGDTPGTARPFIETEEIQTHPVLSPDARWLAYSAGPRSSSAVWVRPYPEGPPIMISSATGTAPVWSRDGRELLYAELTESGDMRWMSVAFAGARQRGAPRVLFSRASPLTGPTRNHDSTPDGRLVLMDRDVLGLGEDTFAPQPVAAINIVQNWFEVLEQRLPPSR